ncbi:MAG: sigma-E factor negative regulatory protein [Proteobacteria bacterium]|nr:sigma-E factor negative regulatory protein [Pseudomonadota bacterium]
MSDKANNQISNLMDGELDVHASKFLLKRMASDATLSKTWENYHLIKSCLQKQHDEPLVIDVASRVSEQLGLQKPVVAATISKSQRWLKPVMGLGIAASVAFMSVFMLQNQQIDSAIINANNVEKIITKNTTLRPIAQQISPVLATSGTTIVPPPFLSRFPSVSAKNSYQHQYSQTGGMQNMNTPYLIIINQSVKKGHFSPMKIKDVSD